jgi:hypothetical protein
LYDEVIIKEQRRKALKLIDTFTFFSEQGLNYIIKTTSAWKTLTKSLD